MVHKNRPLRVIKWNSIFIWLNASLNKTLMLLKSKINICRSLLGSTLGFHFYFCLLPKLWLWIKARINKTEIILFPGLHDTWSDLKFMGQQMSLQSGRASNQQCSDSSRRCTERPEQRHLLPTLWQWPAPQLPSQQHSKMPRAWSPLMRREPRQSPGYTELEFAQTALGPGFSDRLEILGCFIFSELC